MAGRAALLAMTALGAFAPAAVAGGHRTVDILWTETKRYSYGHEELIVRDFFQDRRDGFFVEIGCAWPIKNSNTYFLEKHLGWSGIGVDGVAAFADGWRRARPKSRFFNFLVTGRSDASETLFVAGVLGLSTAEPNVAAGLKIAREIQVPGITLDDLLERSGVQQVDFLSIDVEGHQEEVLAGFDLRRWRPELVCIEDDGPLSIPWFAARGYAPIERYRARDVVNWWFAPADLAAAANGRETERGREALRKREAMLAGEPPGSPARAFAAPRYVLGGDGLPVLNPRWEAETAAACASGACGGERPDATASPGPLREPASEGQKIP